MVDPSGRGPAAAGQGPASGNSAPNGAPGSQNGAGGVAAASGLAAAPGGGPRGESTWDEDRIATKAFVGGLPRDMSDERLYQGACVDKMWEPVAVRTVARRLEIGAVQANESERGRGRAPGVGEGAGRGVFGRPQQRTRGERGSGDRRAWLDGPRPAIERLWDDGLARVLGSAGVDTGRGERTTTQTEQWGRRGGKEVLWVA